MQCKEGVVTLKVNKMKERKEKKTMLKYFGRIMIFVLVVVYSTTGVFAKQYTLNGSKVNLSSNTLYLNGERFKGDEINPLNINNRVYIAVQDLEKLVQSKVKWDKKKEIINVIKDDKHIQMKKGDSYYKLNGNKIPFDDGTKVQIVNSRSMIPLSFAIEEFNLDYDYDSKKKILYLNQGKSLFLDDEEGQDISIETKSETIQEVFEGLGETMEPKKEVPQDLPEKIETPEKTEAQENKPQEIVAADKEIGKSPASEKEIGHTAVPSEETQKNPASTTESVIENKESTVEEKKEQEVPSSPVQEEKPKLQEVPVVKEDPVVPPVTVKKGIVASKKDGNKESLVFQFGDSYRYDTEINGNVISINFPYMELSYRLDELKTLSFVDDMQVVSDEEKDSTVASLFVRSGINPSSLKIEKNNRSVVIRYVQQSTVAPTTLSYKKDRAHSIFKIPVPQSSSVIEVSKRENTFEAIIPKSVAKLPLTRVNGSAADRMIHYYEISSLDDNKYKVEVSLKDRVEYHVLSDGSDGSFTVRFNKGNHTPPKILIDPGHGGKDSGAVKNGLKEKELNMEVCSFLVPSLRELGYDVVTTRDDDSYPTLDDRANLANQVDADLFISIHHNSASRTAVKGMEFYYYSSADSKKFATLTEKHLIGATGAANRGVKNAKFLVIRKTHMPAVLLELGFMTNVSEAQQLADPNYQKTMSDALVAAINEYFGR